MMSIFYELKIYSFIIFLTLPITNCQYYGDRKQQQYYDNRIIDPILTPIINWFDLYNKQESPQFAHSEDVENTVTHSPNPILRSFNVYPSRTTTTQAPNFMDNFLRPFIEPIQRELEKGNQIKQFQAKKQPNTPKQTFQKAPTMNYKQASLSNLLESIGMNGKPKNELEVGRDKSISILGMPVGQKDGLMLSPLKGLSLGKQDLFGPITVHNDYKINWDFLDNLGSIFNSKY